MIVTIDNKKFETDHSQTVLQVAKENGIYIPNLCAHPELTSYGACRLCIIELEGRKGYPTACTTMVEDGMVVRTDTKILQEMRKEILQLILSEHPSACLMCEDIEGCTGYQETIRKVGVSTGCRWCPKDRDCELQKIVESFSIKELTLPNLYRDLPIEKYDPFFDRDYNLCIYCGRCVRICNEYRKSSVLSLRQRGKQTTIGPAFDQNHIDANCEFCGACVSVCPTGAMSEKSRKWWGVPDKSELSVCPLCSLNCEIQVQTLKNKIVGTIPIGNPHESGGELCVKGRFCLSELVNRTERLLEPQYRYPEGYGFVNWDYAIDKSAELIRDVLPNRSAVLISPSLTLEEYSATKIFTENVLQTSLISSSCIDDNLMHYVNLAQNSVSLDEIRTSDFILSIFFDGNYIFAPITMAIKDTASNKVPYIQIGFKNDTTTRFAQKHFIPYSGTELEIIEKIYKRIKHPIDEKEEIDIIVKHLLESKQSIIIIGPQILSLSRCKNILEILSLIIEQTNSKIIMPNSFANLYGLFTTINTKSFSEIQNAIENNQVDLLYLIGDSPFKDRPNVKTIIYQNSFKGTSNLNPDIILPTTTWGESEGIYFNSFGKRKYSPYSAEPHGYAKSNIEIMKGITSTLNKSINLFENETKKIIPEKLSITLPTNVKQHDLSIETNGTNSEFPFLLFQERVHHVFNGINLSESIAGFNDLIKPNQLMINPSDAKKLNLKNGDSLKLISRHFEKTFEIFIRNNIAKNIFSIHLLNGTSGFETNPCAVKIWRDDV